ncbi:hypothetical protein ABT024_04845 [Streptomyces sp. NPDC002812]|uniref:hypothetical protein n=1 Tax=Streptomyces sp. NPDC002812 TaxID=3154434 RepID=UPI003319EB73
MNSPAQLPPLPGHRAPRRRIARDLLGLFLIGAGTVGLLGALYTASPLVSLLVAGLVLAAGGLTVLIIAPPFPRYVRIFGGYLTLSLGLWVLIGVVCYLTPWSLLFALLLAAGVWLSGEET